MDKKSFYKYLGEDFLEFYGQEYNFIDIEEKEFRVLECPNNWDMIQINEGLPYKNEPWFHIYEKYVDSVGDDAEPKFGYGTWDSKEFYFFKIEVVL